MHRASGRPLFRGLLDRVHNADRVARPAAVARQGKCSVWPCHAMDLNNFVVHGSAHDAEAWCQCGAGVCPPRPNGRLRREAFAATSERVLDVRLRIVVLTEQRDIFDRYRSVKLGGFRPLTLAPFAAVRRSAYGFSAHRLR
jgi:hypothetical protein